MTDNPVPEMYMVMKILALHGSPRTIQSSTRKLAGFVLAGAIRNGYSDPVQEKILAENRGYFRTIVTENRDFRTSEYDE
jgi:hypothetical protein